MSFFSTRTKYLRTKVAFIAIAILFFIISPVYATWDGNQYQPGATLNPECTPTQTGCSVIPPLVSSGNASITNGSLNIAPSAAAGLTLQPFGTSSGNTAEIRLAELVANGAQYVGFKAPDQLNANILFTLPNSYGSNNQVLTTDGSGVLSWAAPSTGGISLLNGLSSSAQTFTTNTTGVDFAINSSGSTHTFNLPSASSIARGLLSSTDWTTFNSKENTIIASITATYFRGDKTFQTLDTSVVPENGNVYYTDARFDNRFALKTTSDLPEGAGLYFTDTRAHAVFSADAPLSYDSDTGGFTISQASDTADGFLSSADWTAFNNKLNTELTDGFVWVGDGNNVATPVALSGDATIDNSGMLTIAGNAITSAKILDGTITNADLASSTIGLTLGTMGTDVNVSGTPVSLGEMLILNIPSASSTARGLLLSTDWTAFNNKENVITASTTNTYYRGDKSFQTLDTSVVSENGNMYYTDARFNARLAAITTGDLAEGSNLYFTDARTRNALSTTEPLSYNSSTGAFGISQASSGASGYLSSTDWNTFNGKLGALLNNGLIWVGNSSGTATAVTLSGDATISDTGVLTIFDASATARGLVSTSAQTFAGDKTFSGSLTLSPMTQGSLLFSGVGGLVSQNDANLFWDNTNKRLGIATNAPTGNLSFGSGSNTINATATNANLNIYTNGSGVLYLDSGTAGQVLIGAAPALAGKQIIIGTSTLPTLYLRALTTSIQGDVVSLGQSSSGVAELRFAESLLNGINYVGFKSPDALTVNTLYTLPTADGSNGQTLSTNGAGALAWIAPAGSGWGLTGNSGTVAGTNFIGTTDDVNFVLRSNNTDYITLRSPANGPDILVGAGLPIIGAGILTVKGNNGTNIETQSPGGVLNIGNPSGSNINLIGGISSAISASTALGLQMKPFAVGAGNTTELKFLELAANGTNYTGFKSPDSLAANTVYTLPNADGASGQLLQTNGSGALAWAAAAVSATYMPQLVDETAQQGTNGNVFIYRNQLYAMGEAGLLVGEDGNYDALTPLVVPVQNGPSGWSQVVATYDHACALSNIGTVYCWGNNAYGQLGDNTTTNNYKFAKQIQNGSMPGGTVITKLFTNRHRAYSGNRETMFALASDGKLYAWGANFYGQIGDGSTITRNTPVLVGSAVFSGKIIAKVSINGTERVSVVAVDSTGQLYTWGNNEVGQLGQGDTTDRSAPTAVSGFTNVSDAIATGDHTYNGTSGSAQNYTVALKTNGTVWTAGANGYGQLGDNSTTQRNNFVQESTLRTDIAKIYSGSALGGETAMVSQSGNLYLTGYNGDGQLGDNSTTNRTAYFSPIGAFQGKVAKVQINGRAQSGYGYIYILDTDGNVWAAGRNAYGQLGIGNTTGGATYFTKSLRNTDGKKIIDVRAYGLDDSQGAIILLEDGSLMTTGRSNIGQSGNTTQAGTYSTAFRYVHGFEPGSKSTTVGSTVPMNLLSNAQSSNTVDNTNFTQALNWSTLSTGNGLALSADQLTSGSVLNLNSSATSVSGSLGSFSLTGNSSSVTGSVLNVAVSGANSAATGLAITNAGSGLALDVHSGAVAFQKGVDYSTAGVSNDTPFANASLIRLTGVNPVISGVSGGIDGKILTVMNVSGTSATFQNQNAGSVAGNRIITGTGSDLVIGNDSSVTLQYDAGALRWRVISSLGTVGAIASTPVNNYIPQLMDVSIIYGRLGNIFIYRNQLYSMGIGSGYPYGPNGDAQAVNMGSPSLVPVNNPPSGWSQVVGTYDSACALSNVGTVYCWGFNSSGQLGQGDTTARYLATKVIFPGGASTITSITTNTNFEYSGAYTTFYAIDSTGKVWAWGANNWGQLGDGTVVNKTTPTQVGSAVWAGKVITKISASGTYAAHAAALDSTGQLYTWGYNGVGELGQGDTTDRSNPTAISGFTSVRDVKAIGGHNGSAAVGATFVLKNDGTVWGAGRNADGELGDNTTTNRSSFAQAIGVSGITKIFAGEHNTAAVNGSGVVYLVGWNGYGQLGNNSTANALTYISPAGAFQGKVSKIVITGISSTGAYATIYILDTDGNLWSAGYNGRGQLGAGGTTNTTATTPGVFQQVIRNTDGSKIADFTAYGLDTRGGALIVLDNGAMMTTGDNQNGGAGNDVLNQNYTTTFKYVIGFEPGSKVYSTASNVSLSSVIAATAANTVDNTNWAQALNWSTLTSNNAFSLGADNLTTGSLLSLTSNSPSLNSANGLLYVGNTGASASGTIARIQSNSTAGSGLTVLANGNVGIGISTPSDALTVNGNLKFLSQATTIGMLDSTAGAAPALAVIGAKTTANNGVGGAINITGGLGGTGLSTGGSVNISSGNGLSGGAITLQGSNNINGGPVRLYGGSGGLGGSGGALALTAGNSSGNNAIAGSINITAGNITSGSNTTAGSITLQAGTGGTTNGNIILSPSSGGVGIGTANPTEGFQTNNKTQTARFDSGYGSASVNNVAYWGLQDDANNGNITKGFVWRIDKPADTGSPANLTLRLVQGFSNSCSGYPFCSLSAINGTGVDALTFAGNGNVGIGTAAPGAKLEINTGGGTGSSLKLEQAGSNFIVRPVSSGGSNTVIENTSGGALVINPNGGNVGIGTANPGYKLEVAGNLKIGTVDGPLFWHGIPTITNTGGSSVCANATAVGLCTSLSQYKTNVTDITNALALINGLRPVNYDWKDGYYNGERGDIGLIAEDVQALDPRLAEYNIDGSLTGVRYDHMVALVVKGVQEQQLELTGLSKKTQGLQFVDGQSVFTGTVSADKIVGLEVMAGKYTDLATQVQALSTQVQSPNTETPELLDHLSSRVLDTLESAGAVTFAGNITVKGESIFENLATFSKNILVSGNALFKANATFEKAVVFADGVTFKGRVTYEDKDLAGLIKIKKGADLVKVEYEKLFEFAPVVSVSAKKTGVSFTIFDESVKGFTVKLDQTAAQDSIFSWIAIPVKDAKTYESVDNIIPSPIPSPSATPFVSVTPTAEATASAVPSSDITNSQSKEVTQ